MRCALHGNLPNCPHPAMKGFTASAVGIWSNGSKQPETTHSLQTVAQRLPPDPYTMSIDRDRLL
jgi:hypothetical protein